MGLHPPKRCSSAQLCVCEAPQRTLIPVLARLGLTAVFTKFCIFLQQTQFMPLVSLSTCECLHAVFLHEFLLHQFLMLSAGLLKNISVQRPQIQYMFCLHAGQNVLTNKYSVCLLKQKSGCNISLYLKIIEFMKSKRQQTDKLLFSSISSGKDVRSTIYGSFYSCDIIWGRE